MRTTNRLTPQFVPASLLRIRCFLSAEGRIRVKPWATVEETLDAFHETLVSNRGNDAFWERLKTLLALLSDDLKKRIVARDGEIVDNELLDQTRQQRLLDEIRTALSYNTGQAHGFRRLVASLLPSPSAIALLAILGSVITQGCYASSTGPDTQDAATGPTDSSAADEVTRDDPLYEKNDSGSSSVQIKDSGNSIPDTGREVSTVPPIVDTIVDTGIPQECRSSEIGLVEIVKDCVTDAVLRSDALDCIENLNDSWRTGITEIFQCEDCYTIASQLSDYIYCGDACTNSDPGEFDRDAFLDGCVILIYLGVNFE